MSFRAASSTASVSLRSLASDPVIWFLDEPFSALDPLIRADLQDEVIRLQRQLGKTVVFITHDLDEAIKIADRIAIMDQGRIIQLGSPEELVFRPADEYVARFTKAVPRAKVVRVATIMRPATDADRPGDLSVRPEQRVGEVASIVLGGVNSIAVRGPSNSVVGYVDRETLIGILAGAAVGASVGLSAERQALAGKPARPSIARPRAWNVRASQSGSVGRPDRRRDTTNAISKPTSIPGCLCSHRRCTCHRE